MRYVRYLYRDSSPYVQWHYNDYDEWQGSLSFRDRLTVSLAWVRDLLRYSVYPQALRQLVWRQLILTLGAGVTMI